MTATPSIELFGGGYLDLRDPDPAMIRLGDVAHGLSQTCRYAGHCRRFYSVAEHAILVFRYLVRTGAPLEVRLAGLHHDDPEAYIGDVTRPLKLLLPDYAEVERRLTAVVREGLGLGDLPFEDPRVKAADDWALAAEAWHLLPSRGKPWVPVEYVPNGEYLPCLPPEMAERIWFETHATVSGIRADAQRIVDATDRPL